jgi:nicotinamidase-related amidase
MRIEKENTIGLVIDMQERLFPVMSNRDDLLANCITLLIGLQELSVPLLVTQQYTKGLGETLPEIVSVVNDFAYVEKTTFSCYDEPDFVEKLESSNARNVLICGIESHVCVLQTAVDLKAAGYNPIIILDAVCSRAEKSLKIALERFRYEGILITSVESILFELTRGAKAPEFKAISKLVK